MELNLPYDSATEKCILGTVIENPTEYDTVSKYIINNQVFYQDKARRLWYKIGQMIKAKENIDMISVCSSLNGTDTKIGLTAYYVTECTSNTTSPGAVVYHANQVYEKYLLRRVIVHSEKIKEKAKELFGDVEVADAYMYEGKEGVKVFLGPANEAGRKEDRIDILPHSLHVWYEFTDKVTEFCDWLLENVYLMKDTRSEKNN